MERVRYVALVAVDRPWRDPVAERRFAVGEPGIALAAPPGRYRALCVAEHQAAVTLPPFELSVGGTHSIDCEPDPLRDATGVVRAAGSSQPIAGARLLPVQQVVADNDARLSPLGQSVFTDFFAARSDPEGRFRMRGPAGYRADLWVEAAGYAPALVPEVVFDGDAAKTITLKPGGGATVTMDAVDEACRARWWLGLRPMSDRALPVDSSGLGDGWSTLVQRIWLRPLPRRGATTWDALPLGRFEVVLRDRARIATPIVLGKVNVRVGDVSSLDVLFPPSACLAPFTAADAAGDLVVFLRDQPPGSIAARHWDRGKPNEVAATVEAASGGTTVRIPGECRADASYTLQTDDAVSAAVVARVPCRDPVAAVLRPRATIHGQLRTPVGHARPTGGVVRVATCGERAVSDRGRALGRFPAVFEQSGRWSADVPAGCIDAALETEGFAPLAWKGLTLVSLASRDLGTSTLRVGASVVARVMALDTAEPLADAMLTLVPEAEIVEVVRASLATGKAPPERTIRADAEGWARFAGVDAGIYYLRAAGEGYAPVFSQPLTMAVGDDLLLDDIGLPRPATVRVSWRQADLATLGPKVEIRASTQVATCGWEEARSVVVPTGDLALELEALPPGTWLVALFAGDGGRSEIARQSVEIFSGGESTLAFDLEGSVYQGVVEDRNGPVAARLRLVRHNADQEPPILHARSDSDGVFSVVISAPGSYQVEASIQDDAAAGVIVPRVVFDDPDESVRIRLPEGAVRGWVEDEHGAPVDGAWIAVTSTMPRELGQRGRDQSRHAESGTNGAFGIERLAPGPWLVQGYDGKGARSRSMEIELGPVEVRDGVVLVLAQGARLRGRVTARGQPVAGVAGSVRAPFGTSPTDGMGGGGIFVTDAEGAFELHFDPGAEGLANLVVQAEGHPIMSQLTWVPGEIEVALPVFGGRLRVEAADGALNLAARSLMLIREDGSAISFNGIRSLVPEGGVPPSVVAVIVPSLAAGAWRLVDLLANGIIDIPFVIEPGQTTTIQLPPH